MIGGLDWGALQSFLTSACAERLTVAAKREGIDHSTLSRRINLLERSQETILFERTPSGYVLTLEGHSVLLISEEMESASLKIASDTPGHTRAISGVARIAAPDVFGNRFLARHGLARLLTNFRCSRSI
jgi:DNA-binding transcriptional LysR family regulator